MKILVDEMPSHPMDCPYYKEEVHTEHRIMAEAINDLFMKYKDVFCGDEG